MLKETLNDPAQNLRAFMDTDCSMHLKVWYADGTKMDGLDGITEFRLTYDLIDDGHGIVWRKKEKDGEMHEMYAHTGIDDGEDKVVTDPEGHKMAFSHKQSPTLVLNGAFEESDVIELAKDFLWRAGNIDRALAGFVFDKIRAFPPAQFVHRHQE